MDSEVCSEENMRKLFIGYEHNLDELLKSTTESTKNTEGYGQSSDMNIHSNNRHEKEHHSRNVIQNVKLAKNEGLRA